MIQTDAFSDLIKKEQLTETVLFVKDFLSSESDEIKLGVFREIMLDQIYSIIDKFPLHTQK